MKLNLLVTVRDVAGAAHLVEVIRALELDGRFNFRVIAQAPASGFLSNLKIPHTAIGLKPARDLRSREASDLLQLADEILQEFRADGVLVGLSTPFDGGIDEAALAQAKVPTFLMQDFWGEQNKFFGRGADVFFVLDESAKQRNHTRFGVESVIVGSARHSVYASRDFVALKHDKRRELGIPVNANVIGYFGQALHHMAGYRNTVSHFIDVVGGLNRDVRLLVRMHPRETSEQFNSTETLFRQSALSPIFVNTGSVDDCLAACDVVCSLFSNCTYDASYQNFFAASPIAVPISMLFEPDIADYCRERVDLEKLPIHAKKLVVPVYEKATLGNVLERCFEEDFRRQVWSRAKTELTDPSQACGRIIDEIYRRIRH